MSRLVLCLILAASPPAVRAAESLTPSLTFERGPINAAILQRGDSQLAVYGSAGTGESNKPELVLVTHHRRDVVWAARQLIGRGAKAVAPAAERDLLEKPHEFWNAFTTRRFHDYAQQTTKIVAEPFPVERWVAENDTIDWRGIAFRVLDTPGYTRGSVSYVADVDGKRVAFTGDLIYGDGQLIDLYSFQDEISTAKVGGYHGYGSRLALLIPSLRKIAAEKPDLIVPARGPVIRDPRAAIERLIGRVQAIYRNYLSTNALNWYFKEERMRTSGERVLGQGAHIELMPYSLHQTTPDWVWEQGTSRLLISDEGHGFLLDCGYPQILDAVKKIRQEGLVNKIDGIFVTHYHDDHTNSVQAAAEEFQCPVYATVEYQDILERPGAYRMPALTSNAIKNVKAMRDGQTMTWQEFELTFYFYPGQAIYHGGLYVKKQGEKPIFFIGDSFSPSGIDDYCVLNRNLIHEDSGYLFCLNKLRQFKGDFWLVNEHIPHVFSFSESEMQHLVSRYRERIGMLRELFPWDDPNYGIDEQWAVFYPYGTTARPEQNVELEVRITNHSPGDRTYVVTPRVHSGTKLVSHESGLTLRSRQSGKVRVVIQPPAKSGAYVVTADVESDGLQFRDWVEALISVDSSH